MSLSWQRIHQSDCTVELSKADRDLYEGIVHFLGLLSYFFECVYSDMLLSKLNDVSGVQLSYIV